MVPTNLHDGGPGRSLPPPARSYAQQLRDLLSEIQQTADDTDVPTPVSQSLGKVRLHARHLDEGTAKMLLEAIQLGEEFACLYVQEFLEFPPRPQPCRRPTYSCS